MKKVRKNKRRQFRRHTDIECTSDCKGYGGSALKCCCNPNYCIEESATHKSK